MNFLTLFALQCALTLCGDGPGTAGGAPVGTMAFVAKAQGQTVNQAATCGATAQNPPTCQATITAASGDVLLISTGSLNGRNIASISCSGTLNVIPGQDQSGKSNTASTTIAAAWIILTAQCVNPLVTFDAGTGNGEQLNVFDYSISAGVPVLDAYGTLINTAGAGSPFNGPAMTCTGSSEAVLATAFAVSTITAIGAPFNTNQQLHGEGNWIGVEASSSAGACTTPPYTAAANTQSAALGFALSLGGSGCTDWTEVNPLAVAGSAGSAPVTTAGGDLEQNTNGFIGSGNNTIGTPAYAISNGTTGITYAAAGSPVTSPNIGSKRLCKGGVTDAGTGGGVFDWSTSTVTKGQLSWRPPNGLTHVTYGQWFMITVPSNVASGQWSLPSTNASVTDIVNPLIQTTGTQLNLVMECNNVAGGSIFSNLQPNHWYWIAHDFTTGNGSLGKLALYDTDGVTLLGNNACTNTAAGTVTLVGIAGISGGEAEEPGGGHHLYFGRHKIDRTGATAPMLPGS